jgi:hypothetical protein
MPYLCLGAAAVQVEEVVEVVDLVQVVLVEGAVVLVGSSFAPPSQSPLVPPLPWWWDRVELEVVAPTSFPPPLVATLPLALTLPWWPLVGGQALQLLETLLPAEAPGVGVASLSQVLPQQ